VSAISCDRRCARTQLPSATTRDEGRTRPHCRWSCSHRCRRSVFYSCSLLLLSSLITEHSFDDSATQLVDGVTCFVWVRHIGQSVCLSVSLSVCHSVNLSVSPSVSRSVSQFVSQSGRQAFMSCMQTTCCNTRRSPSTPHIK
jgi:hypothetical protein